MVKASKWFRKLLMMRGGGDPKSSPSSRDAQSSHSYSKRKEKEKHSMRWTVGRGRAILHGGNEEEEEDDEEEMVQVQQNRVVNRQGVAMAVAAATVAAADAAVSAAQAAAKLVRLTSINGHFFIIDGGVINREQWAAIRIQSAFRGYLSQRAIRALKGVVKLQALVRGQIVRRQATITLQCMQSLLRVQAKVQAQRNTLLKAHQSETNNYKQGRPLLERSVDNGDVEKRWSWLDDRWIATRTIDNPVFDSDATDRRDDGVKIVEMDTAKVVVVKKRNDSMSEPCSPFSPSNISSSPSSTMASLSSIPTMLNNPFMGEGGRTRRNLRVNEDYYSREVFHSNTNNNSTGSNSIISSNIGTPLPNYMTTTHSSKAKVRSLSEPKQRPDSQLTPLRTRHSLMVHNEKEPVKPRPFSSLVNSKGGDIHGPFNVDHNYTTSLKERHYSRH